MRHYTANHPEGIDEGPTLYIPRDRAKTSIKARTLGNVPRRASPGTAAERALKVPGLPFNGRQKR